MAEDMGAETSGVRFLPAGDTALGELIDQDAAYRLTLDWTVEREDDA